jgi:phage terminase large subunit
MYRATTATRKLLALRQRIKGVAGGTSAGKTISILTILIDKAQSDTTPTLTSIVSESYPHLKRGAMRDFRNIMEAHGYWQDQSWNATDSIYTYETGSKIEFFSADQPSKVRGPRRDRLYVNEANNVSHGAFDQLEVRTKSEVWLDWNPTNEFWWYDEVAPNREHDFITLTYLDNEALDPQIVASIEARRNNKAWWLVYGLGQLGEVEGKIFTDLVRLLVEDDAAVVAVDASTSAVGSLLYPKSKPRPGERAPGHPEAPGPTRQHHQALDQRHQGVPELHVDDRQRGPHPQHADRSVEPLHGRHAVR